MHVIDNQIIQNSYKVNSRNETNSENKTLSFETYLNAINEAQSVKNSAYSKETTKVDYSNYSIYQIKEIPYEEAKVNYDAIKQRISEFRKEKELSFYEDNIVSDIATQIEKAKKSDNDKLNEAMYETLRAIKDPVESMTIASEMQTNLQDYYYGKPVNASFVVSNNDIHAHEILTRAQLNSINVEDFLSKMVGEFSEDYENAPMYVKNQYKQIVDGYNLFQQNYNQTKKESYYA